MSDNVQIEMGVAVPPPKRNPAQVKYPFKEMEVGASFFIPFEEGELLSRARKRIYAAVAWANNQHKSEGKRFITRTVDNGMRVWREQ